MVDKVKVIHGISLFLLIIISGCKNEIREPGSVDIAELLIGEIKVDLNPHDIAPLSAVARFSTEYECVINVNIEGRSPVEYTFEKKDKKYQIPILGLYPNRENKVILKLTDEFGRYAHDTLKVKTISLPKDLPEITIDILQKEKMEPGFNLAELSMANQGKFSSYPIIFDENGDIRWCLDLRFTEEITHPIKRLKNGDLLVAEHNHLYEYTMVGELLNDWELKGYAAHHEVLELPSGNFLVAVGKAGATVNIEGKEEVAKSDFMIELDRQTGEVKREWDFRKILDVDRKNIVAFDEGNWVHINAMYFDESDETIIVSGRNQGVFKVNMDNELIWIMAPKKGWGSAGENGEGAKTEPFLLTAIDKNGNEFPDSIQTGEGYSENFDWPWGQHAPMLLPNGNIFLFDNGVNRRYAGKFNYSRAVEYKVDEENKTVCQIWEYGKGRGADFFSLIVSDVDLLPETNNRFVISGAIPGEQPGAKFVELTYPDKEVVFEATLTVKNINGTGQYAWGQLDIIYRGERMSLYPKK